MKDGTVVLGAHVPPDPTVTVVVAVADPPLPVTVRVYVVVVFGVTVMLPEVGTDPMPTIVADVAFVLVQVSVDDCPGLMLVGFAVMDPVGAPEVVPTVTVAVDVAVAPFAPVAVAV